MPGGSVPEDPAAGPTQPSGAPSELPAGGFGCVACGGIDFVDRQVLPDLRTRTCIRCGLISSSIDRAGPGVPEFALVDQDAYLRSVGATRKRQAAPILEWLTEQYKAGAKLLDVGCSFGFFLLEAKRAGFTIQGLEPDPQAYEYCRRLLGEGVVRRGILDEAGAHARSPDIVTTLDVIEHIPPKQHRAFAGRVRDILTPQGVWVIKVPSTEGLYYRLSGVLASMYPKAGADLVRRMWQTRYEYPHLVYFSLRSLSRWLDRFGFVVLAHRYVPEVPTRTVIDRLSTDGDISRAKAWLIAPAVVGVNIAESLRGKSDGLVVFARPRS